MVENEDHIQLALVVGAVIPVSPQQGMPLPLGVLRVPLGKKAATEKGKEILEAAERLPAEQKHSDILIASDMRQAENVARQAQQFKI